MLTRSHVWPQGHWDWPIHVSHKHGCRAGDMIFIGGQVDLDSRGNVQRLDDLQAQTAAVMRHIVTVLAGFAADAADLVALRVFYRMDRCDSEADMLSLVSTALTIDAPGPVVTLVPLPALAYAGMVVEIEAVAMRGRDGARMPRIAAAVGGLATLPAPLSHGLRCGPMVFVGGQSTRDANGSYRHAGDLVAQSHAVMERAGTVLAALGVGFDDAVKINRYYVGAGTAGDWQASALACASRFAEPGPAATGLPLPRLQHPDHAITVELVAMSARDGQRMDRDHVWPEGHWDWPVHLPYQHGLRCGEMVYIGGQVSIDRHGQVIDADDLEAQTRTSMANIERVLAGFGMSMDNVVKVNAFYQGGASADTLHRNLQIRSDCFTEPGPATTGVPLPVLAYRGMVIEIEVVAML